MALRRSTHAALDVNALAALETELDVAIELVYKGAVRVDALIKHLQAVKLLLKRLRPGEEGPNDGGWLPGSPPKHWTGQELRVCNV
jgi:hypothetical protein